VVTDAIVVCDAAGSILDLNEEAAALFGIARAAATGMPSADLLIAAESQAAFTRSLRTLAGQKARLIATARRADGSTFEAEVRMAPGGADLRFLSFRDLSAELRNSEAASHLDAVLSAAPLVLFLLDDRGKITLSVGKALDRFGVNPNQHVGRELAEVYSHIPQVAEDVELALKGETVVSLTHNPRSGLNHETVYKPILGQGGVATSVIAVANDVTDHVRAEQAVEESEAKSRLLNVMNHEVRTPLNSILGFTDLLVGLRAGPLNKKQLRYLENIGRAGRHLLALVNDSLDLAKIEAGQMELALHDCEVVEVIEHTAALIEPLVESRGLELRLDAPWPSRPEPTAGASSRCSATSPPTRSRTRAPVAGWSSAHGQPAARWRSGLPIVVSAWPPSTWSGSSSSTTRFRAGRTSGAASAWPSPSGWSISCAAASRLRASRVKAASSPSGSRKRDQAITEP
jgi:PAS domain S-box-containing protein